MILRREHHDSADDRRAAARSAYQSASTARSAPPAHQGTGPGPRSSSAESSQNAIEAARRRAAAPVRFLHRVLHQRRGRPRPGVRVTSWPQPGQFIPRLSATGKNP